MLNSGAIKSFRVLLSANVFSQAINLIVTIYIATMYAPEAFGQFQIYFSVSVIFVLISSLRLDLAIIAHESDRDVPVLVITCIGIIFLISLMLGLLISVYVHVRPIHDPIFDKLIWALPIGTFIGGIIQALNAYAIRIGGFRVMAASKLFYVLGFGLVAIILGWQNGRAEFLIFADLAARLSAVTFLALMYSRSIFQSTRTIDRHSISHVLKTNQKFIYMTTPGSLISAITTNILPIFVYNLFGASATGVLAIVERVLVFPATLVANTASQVFSNMFSKNLRTNAANNKALVLKISLSGFLLVSFPVFIIVFSQEFMLDIFVNTDWASAGVMSLYLAPLLVARAISTPINTVLVLSGKQSIQLIWECSRSFFLFLGLSLCAVLQISLMNSIGLYASITLVMSVAFVYLATRVAGRLEGATNGA